MSQGDRRVQSLRLVNFGESCSALPPRSPEKEAETPKALSLILDDFALIKEIALATQIG